MFCTVWLQGIKPIAADRKFTEFQINMGTNRAKDAIPCLQKAMKWDENNSIYLFMASDMAMRSRLYSYAAELLEKIHNTHNGDLTGWAVEIKRGLAKRGCGDVVGAVEAFKLARLYNPTLPEPSLYIEKMEREIKTGAITVDYGRGLEK